ncbi:hypothetical protein [Marinobacterium sediminicola]|uniref:Uncharacterized protein n=1 Tax=Marinobacterium sediminicola TaxID=518898 RepID=A0ABY1S1L7_9GAMM|nr:hypothetical protein [Marinobacterium sediminicola]ULG69788.1 hypothetical protein LN244_02990 [Marinobacterium sediminicola]SMR75398.1 hypothetical protein SAMN04487964_10960 [Marinobacterium sediminicola]
MQTDSIQARIETYTASLPQAVHSPNGAQFAFLLSLIASNQEIYRPQPQQSPGEGFALPGQALSYPDPAQLHTSEVVDRLNHSINDPIPGDYAFLVSRLDVQARTPRAQALASDRFEQVALYAASNLAGTIATARQSINVKA